ncbi:leucine-rich repeat-containing G-protein coupled receptor 5-like isoform X2 [Larimichthys crocea]|nr:leucine-rich repeat-containing G-protein coupled receptor 5-like isoform X2 [Larimichthys crocea]XP_027131578.1 leucine-rich repeat-containing G-protein coupled receptor 5-like isoform X2 [Larimichthys crocea]XP_027131579.1 leucine-rich repeat-containing G-protein coupled receptor 5-like isoform X2 [Larimichthys crocea]
MKHLLVLVLGLPYVVGIGGGSVSGDCPAECRCESVGTLQRVNCVNAGLRSLPPNLSSFTLSLHLDANFLSCLPASSFKGLSSLRYLWLDDNILMEIPVLPLSHLMALQALTLALNNISYIPDRAFAALHQLMVLHLHNNLITSVGRRSFDGLYNLVTLDLSFNRINSFPSAIKHLKNLRHLNLQNNEISVIPENSFIRNPSIQTINIQNNPIHTVSTLVPKIQRLALSSVRLSSSCLLKLKHLKYLNLQLRVSTHLQHKVYGYKTSVSSFSSNAPSGGLDLSLFYFSVSFIFIICYLQPPPSHPSQLVFFLFPFQHFLFPAYDCHPCDPSPLSGSTNVKSDGFMSQGWTT